MRRAILIEGTGKFLELKKVAAVKLEHSENEFIYLDKIKDSDGWRLTYTEKTIPDIKDVEAFRIIREE